MRSIVVMFTLCILTLVSSCARTVVKEPRADEIRGLMERYVTEFNRRQSPDVMDEFLAIDYVWHLPGEDVVGREAVKRRFVDLFSQNSAVKLTAEDVIAANSTAVVRWTIAGVGRETGERWQHAGITIDRVSPKQFLEGWELGADKPWLKGAQQSATGARK